MLLFSLIIPLPDTFVSTVELFSELIMKFNNSETNIHQEFLKEFFISRNEQQNDDQISPRIKLYLFIIIQQCSIPIQSLSLSSLNENRNLVCGDKEEKNDYRITEMR